MASLHFKSIIKIREGNPYILVSAKQATELKPGWKKPLPVLVQVNDEPQDPWSINMMPVGDGSFYLYLHGTVREASHTKVGDTVSISLRFDETYKNGPMHPMPEWFQIALEKNEKAHKNWSKLPPSRQKEILRYFSWLKSEDAKDRNVKKAIFVLSGNSGRFMARDWSAGK